VRATVIEGCIGETVAAIAAEAQRDGAEDEAVRAALTIIAHDEARHAELAWKTVAWVLQSGDAGVRAAVRDAFAVAAEQLPAIHTGVGLAAHGRLDPQAARRIAGAALAEVVLPCARALLSSAPEGPQNKNERTHSVWNSQSNASVTTTVGAARPRHEPIA
jgi:hypothetical protein